MKKLTNSTNGVFSGIASGMCWGLDTVIVGIILNMSNFNCNSKIIFLAPFVSTFLRDTFSAIILTLITISKGNFRKVMKGLKTKSGLFIAIGAILGGPIGMTSYMFSVKYIGPGYTANISAIYPAVGAVLAYVFLNEKLKKRSWIGIILSVSGILVLGYSAGSTITKYKFILGILFALICVLGWASESVVCAYGMKEDIGPYEALNIRQLVSASVYGFIILPIMRCHFVTRDIILTKVSIMLALSALVGTISYLLWYKAIHTIGSARSTALNITYAVWSIIFQKLILNIQVTNQLMIGSMIVMLGTILVSGNLKEILNLKKYKYSS